MKRTPTASTIARIKDNVFFIFQSLLLIFAFALLLTVMGVKSKYNCRSITYILLFGCYFVIKDIKWVILVAGICTIGDEFVCRPLHKYYHEKAVINKEIDKRYDVQQREE